MEATLKKVFLFTDGACRGNPGPGGWGVLMKYGHHQKEFYGGELHTTNNRMELIAVIEGLSQLKYSCHVEVTTDSQYVRLGVIQWLPNWKARQWKTVNKKPVKNQDLWQRLENLISLHHINWHWVKGHSGHNENERADVLANLAIDILLKKEVKQND